jgi:phage terminase small subunit
VAERQRKTPKTTAANRREAFVREYLVDLNATQAAIRAGYSAKTAYAQGCRLLKDAEIAAAVAEGQDKRAQRVGITADRVLAELELLAFSDHTHYEVDDEGNVTLAPHAPEGAHRAVSSIKRRITTSGPLNDRTTVREVELKFWDKPGPLKLAGRHVGLRAFMDRLEVTGKDGDPITFTLDLETRGRGE